MHKRLQYYTINDIKDISPREKIQRFPVQLTEGAWACTPVLMKCFFVVCLLFYSHSNQKVVFYQNPNTTYVTGECD